MIGASVKIKRQLLKYFRNLLNTLNTTDLKKKIYVGKANTQSYH